MKMRKVLSFVLVLSLVLGSFSMAFAANEAGLTDIAGTANEDAIQVAYDLDIVTGNPDGTYLPEKAVNRAEFAALITRALAIPDSALAGYTTTTFKDTVGYGWAVPYLAFCQSKGIMIGDGFGNAMPGRTISVNEAMTMALRAIGYTENSSLLVGVWPASYVTIAQTEGLYDDVAATTTVNKASAAQIIYNLLTVQKVAVNADGATDFQTTKIDGDYVAANLLNTNLGAEEVKDAILGKDYDYDNSLINITSNLGAFGTAYVNDDDELVAFTVKSTALTGKIEGSKFKVGDTKYNIATTVTDTAIFSNTVDAAGGLLDATAISNAAINADGGKTVTINVDVSGKNIKQVYSVVAWMADDAALADADVQEDIDNQELLGFDFILDDDDEIDFKSFQLVGVTSLADIDEDNVVYIYAEGNDIRKIAVGTETVEGVIDEIGNDFVTIDGKDYKFPPTGLVNADAVGDFDVDDEGIFYLDYAGKIFDFDGTTGTADSYGVVKAAANETSFDNYKVKLYKSDDSTSTLYLADKAAKIDWTSSSAATISAITGGALIGYSLDSDGDIDAIDNTVMSATNLVFKSTKVLGTHTIDSNAAVFTYTGSIDSGNYDVAKLTDIEVNTTFASTSKMILDGNKVVALFIEDQYADKEDDAIYGVFNARTTASTDGDKVYRFTGFIDGTAFSYKTDDQTNDGNHVGGFDGLAEVFGVYAITLDASDQIKKVDDLAYSATVPNTEASYMVVQNEQVTDLNSDKTVVTVGSGKFTVADDAVVYKWSKSDKEFTVSRLSALRDNGDFYVSLYDTKGSDANGIADIVIFYEN